MAATMKGLLKGLRYISQIFDDSDKEEEEREMQIGHPTDVKHVAHIGLDGPSANSPSWMNGFKETHHSSSERSNIRREVKDPSSPKRAPEDVTRGSKNHVPKPVKNSGGHGHGAPASATEEHPVMSKHSRRRHSAGGSSKELADGTKPGRKHKTNLSDGVEVNLQDSPTIPKHSRRKKSSNKESTASGSTKSRLRSGTSSPFPDAKDGFDGDGGGFGG